MALQPHHKYVDKPNTVCADLNDWHINAVITLEVWDSANNTWRNASNFKWIIGERLYRHKDAFDGQMKYFKALFTPESTTYNRVQWLTELELLIFEHGQH